MSLVAAASCSYTTYGCNKLSICLSPPVWLILASDLISSMLGWLIAGNCLFLLIGDSDRSYISCLDVDEPNWSSSVLTFFTNSLTSFS